MPDPNSRTDPNSPGRDAAARDQELSSFTFLTVAEVASAMRVSKMTVYRLVHAGTLPAVQVGRSFRIREQAVQDYLKDSYYQTG